jgi:Putative ER transporter, 6TM, N-terminal
MTSRPSRTMVHKEVRIDAPMSDTSSPSTAVEAAGRENEKVRPAKDKKKKGIEWNPQKWEWPSSLAWVPGQLNYQGFKPVIRSSIAVWIVSPMFVVWLTTLVVSAFILYRYRRSCWASVLFISRRRIHSTARQPNKLPPFCGLYLTEVPTFLNLCYNMIFVCLAWCVSIFSQLASTHLRGYTTAEDAIRELQDAGYCGTTDATTCLTTAIFKGYFLEITPTVVNAVFFTIAMSITLWVKAKYKKYVFSCVFATICLVITMSYGPLYPYFDGTLGVFPVLLYVIDKLATSNRTEYVLNTFGI